MKPQSMLEARRIDGVPAVLGFQGRCEMLILYTHTLVLLTNPLFSNCFNNASSFSVTIFLTASPAALSLSTVT